MSKFNFDTENVMVMGKPDGWGVELWWQNGDSITFSMHDTMEAAEAQAVEVRRVMHRRVEDIARMGEMFSETIEVFESAIEDRGEERDWVVLIMSWELSVESGPVVESELDGWVESIETWCNEWAMIANEPHPMEIKYDLHRLLSIVTDDLFDGAHFTCAEADTIAQIARQHLSDQAADDFLYRHALGDEAWDSQHHLELIKD
jgi:hypothetical protein